MPNVTVLTRLCGPVELRKAAPDFLGAEKFSNNVAELSGGCNAIKLALQQPADCKVTLGYDSEYARRIICGVWRAKSNYRLAAQARRLYGELLRYNKNIQWLHVDSHTGHQLNEEADALADQGAAGIRLSFRS